jgi:hypothetical protein
MTGPWRSAVASVPCAGHRESGDAAWIAQREDRWRALLVDASGHGESAHRLCQQVADRGVFRADGEITDILARLHDALAGTVGAAALVVDADWLGDRARLRYVGVGNVQLWIDGPAGGSDEGQPGLLGTRFPSTLRVRERTLAVDDRLALVSDGVRREARAHLGAPGSDPRALAARLVHDFARPHDDATCVVLCLRRPP